MTSNERLKCCSYVLTGELVLKNEIISNIAYKKQYYKTIMHVKCLPDNTTWSSSNAQQIIFLLISPNSFFVWSLGESGILHLCQRILLVKALTNAPIVILFVTTFFFILLGYSLHYLARLFLCSQTSTILYFSSHQNRKDNSLVNSNSMEPDLLVFIAGTSILIRWLLL